jgi:hypothetical protein
MRSGERCQSCQVGRMRTRTTITRGSSRVRYLICTSCTQTGKESLRLDDIGRPVFAMHSNGASSGQPETK